MNPADVDHRLRSLADEYLRRKTAAEGQVRRWQWATAPWFDIRPLWLERQNFRLGRLLKGLPKKLNGKVEVGLDEWDRVVCERQYNESGFYETFYDWFATPIEAAHYDYHSDKSPINIVLTERHSNQVVRSDTAAINGFLREDYVWEGPRVVEVRISHAPRVGREFVDLSPLHVAHAIYGGDEQLDRVELHWPPSPPERPTPVVEIAYQRHVGA